jgi:hypothetical protein
MGKDRPWYVERHISHFDIIGVEVHNAELVVRDRKAEVALGKEEIAQPKKVALTTTVRWLVLMGTKVVLWKLR